MLNLFNKNKKAQEIHIPQEYLTPDIPHDEIYKLFLSTKNSGLDQLKDLIIQLKQLPTEKKVEFVNHWMNYITKNQLGPESPEVQKFVTILNSLHTKEESEWVNSVKNTLREYIDKVQKIKSVNPEDKVDVTPRLLKEQSENDINYKILDNRDSFLEFKEKIFPLALEELKKDVKKASDYEPILSSIINEAYSKGIITKDEYIDMINKTAQIFLAPFKMASEDEKKEEEKEEKIEIKDLEPKEKQKIEILMHEKELVNKIMDLACLIKEKLNVKVNYSKITEKDIVDFVILLNYLKPYSHLAILLSGLLDLLSGYSSHHDDAVRLSRMILIGGYQNLIDVLVKKISLLEDLEIKQMEA